MDIDKPLDAMTDMEVDRAASAGVAGAMSEQISRQNRRFQDEERMRAGSRRTPTPSAGAGWFDLIWSTAVLALPVVLLVAVIVGLTRGTTWLAERSWLAPLFPAPGDSVARYALSVATLILLVPGGLLLVVARMDATRLRPLGRMVALPAAVLLVPVILFITQLTTRADLVRWAS